MFLALAYAVAWIPTLPAMASRLGGQDHQAPTVLFLGFGVAPGLAAVVVFAWTRGRQGAAHLLGGFSPRRVKGRWVAATIAGAVAYVGLGRVANMLISPAPPWPSTRLWLGALAAAVPVLVAAALEEAGWRGYLLPALQSHMKAAAASVCVGIAWGLWHLPLLLQTEGPNAKLPIWWYPAAAATASFVYTAIFNSTRGSLLIATLVHALINVMTTPFVQASADAGLNFGRSSLVAVALSMAIAGAVVAVLGATNLSRGDRVRLDVGGERIAEVAESRPPPSSVAP